MEPGIDRRRPAAAAQGRVSRTGRGPGRVVVAALMVAVALLTPGAARADRALMLLPEAPRIRRIRVTGNEALSEAEIKSYLSVKTADVFHPFRRPRLYRGLLMQDLQLIQGVYLSRGYVRASVTSDTVSLANGIELNVRIDEGAPVAVNGVSLRGLGWLDEAMIGRQLRLRRGRPFSPSAVEADRVRIDQYLADRGHPFSRIEPRALLSGDSAMVVYEVDRGPDVRLGEIRIEGSEGFNERGLRRELTVHPGDPFSRRELERSRQRLYDTGSFRDVQIDYPNAEADSFGVDRGLTVAYQVHPRKQRWFGTGVGYSSDGLLRLTGEWGTRNVLGTGRHLRAYVRNAYQLFGPDQLLHFRENYDALTLTEPWLFGTRLRGQLGGYYHYNNVQNEQVIQKILGGGGEVSYELLERRRNIALILESRRVENSIGSDSVRAAVCADDPILCRERYVTRLATLRLTLDGRNDFLNPARGGRLEVLGQNAGGLLGGDNNFLKGLANGSYHFGARRSSVIAARVLVGAINPPGLTPEPGARRDISAVPFEDRFFAGGASSVRGYQENTLNGLPDGKDPTGGGILQLVINCEWRMNVRGTLGAVLFADAGNVWRAPERLQLRHFVPTFDRTRTTPDHLRYSVGGGVRINSPVGPVRLEGAVRLSPSLREWPTDLHLAVGQSF